MAIKNWHVGKLVMLWTWGFVFVGLALSLLESKVSWFFGYPLIGGILVVPAILSVLTWKWLSGREDQNQSSKSG